MKQRRALSLKSETLTDLSTDDLRDVVAGAAAPTVPVDHCLQYSNIQCYTRGTTCAC